MFGATLVFHLASVVFILLLLYRMMAWKKTNRRLLTLVSAFGDWQAPTIEIEWPAKHLQQLCEALGLSFTEGDQCPADGPAKVGVKQFMVVFAAVNISHVQIGVDHPGVDIFYSSKAVAGALPDATALASELAVSSVRYVEDS